MTAYAERVRSAFGTLPGVVGVSVAEVRLLSGNGIDFGIAIPDRVPKVEQEITDPGHGAQINRVGGGFFETLGIPLVTGRALNEADLRPNPSAAVVDEEFVRRFFPEGGPLGRRFGLSDENANQFEVVGVARNARYRGLREDPAPTAYLPLLSGEVRIPVHFAIRTTLDAGQLAAAVRRTIEEADPAVPLTELHTQAGLIDRTLRTERLLGLLSAAFGVIALTLAAIGLGGLLSYAIARRTKEIGVRMALGAAVDDVLRMVVGDSLRMAVMGLAWGAPCAYAAARSLESLLYGLEPADPATALAALLAAWIPARRAASIEPVQTLRQD